MRIVYIDVDSLRPDHMGCYGYMRNTTPNIDSIAKKGARFERAYCEASPCVPSRASFASGRFAINHGALTHFGPGGEFWHPGEEKHNRRYAFFTRHLREAGYKTVTVSSFGDRHEAFWFFAGWNEIYTHTLKTGNEDANEVNEAVLPWIMEHGAEDNYLLHVQYWDPHGFYTCPDEYADQFKDKPAPAFPDNDTIQKQRDEYHPRSAGMFHWAISPNIPKKMPLEIQDRSDVDKLYNGYDGGISFMDYHVGQILEAYRKLGIEDEVAFIISADHGESFGEQNLYMEHGMASETVNHIPLIVRWPGLTKPGQVFDEFVYNVDVVATLTDLVGLSIPGGWDGMSFRSVFKENEQNADWGRDYLVLEHGLYAAQRAVVDDKWFFIRTYHPGMYVFPSVVLYDTETDPHHTTNVAESHPDVVALMDHRIAEFVQQSRDKHGHIPDPMEKILETGPFRYIDPEHWAIRLRDAGLVQEADELVHRWDGRL